MSIGISRISGGARVSQSVPPGFLLACTAEALLLHPLFPSQRTRCGNVRASVDAAGTADQPPDPSSSLLLRHGSNSASSSFPLPPSSLESRPSTSCPWSLHRRRRLRQPLSLPLRALSSSLLPRGLTAGRTVAFVAGGDSASSPFPLPPSSLASRPSTSRPWSLRRRGVGEHGSCALRRRRSSGLSPPSHLFQLFSLP